MGQLLLLFLCNVCSFFSYAGVVQVTNLFSRCYWYIFVIIFLICSDLLNSLRNVGTIVITTKKGLNNLKVIFTEQFVTKNHCFSLFWCILCTSTPDISSSSKNINNKGRVSRLSFGFLWLWNNEYNIKFRVLSTDFRRTVNYGIETITYRASSLWVKLPSEFKVFKEFKVKK